MEDTNIYEEYADLRLEVVHNSPLLAPPPSSRNKKEASYITF